MSDFEPKLWLLLWQNLIQNQYTLFWQGFLSYHHNHLEPTKVLIISSIQFHRLFDFWFRCCVPVFLRTRHMHICIWFLLEWKKLKRILPHRFLTSFSTRIFELEHFSGVLIQWYTQWLLPKIFFLNTISETVFCWFRNGDTSRTWEAQRVAKRLRLMVL